MRKEICLKILPQKKHSLFHCTLQTSNNSWCFVSEYSESNVQDAETVCYHTRWWCERSNTYFIYPASCASSVASRCRRASNLLSGPDSCFVDKTSRRKFILCKQVGNWTLDHYTKVSIIYFICLSFIHLLACYS